MNRCRAHQPFEFHDDRSLARAARAAARAVRDMALGEEMEEESAESGQESEDGPSRPSNSRQVVAPAGGEEVNTDGLAANSIVNQSRYLFGLFVECSSLESLSLRLERDTEGFVIPITVFFVRMIEFSE